MLKRFLLPGLALLVLCARAHAGPFDDIPFQDIPRPGGPKDWAIIRAQIRDKVELVSLRDGKLVVATLSRIQLGGACAKSCLTVDSKRYYADWNAFAARPELFAASMTGVQARAYGRQLADACRALAPNGATARAAGSYSSLCRKPKGSDKGLTTKGDTSYALTALPDGIHLAARVRLEAVDAQGKTVPAARAREMLRAEQSHLPEIAAFWARYGILSDLSFDSSAEPRPGKPDLSVTLVDGYGRHDEDHYYIGYPPAERAVKLIHETGHLYGLRDEYGGTECPDRPFIAPESDPWSVMEETDKPADRLELFPRHVIQVLRPLCGA